MITEEVFKKEVFDTLGLKLGSDYGFIAGTMHPFGAEKTVMHSAMLGEGYRVWRKYPNGDLYTKQFKELNISGVIDFLAGDLEPDDKSILAGEYAIIKN